MRRQLPTGINDADQTVSGRQTFNEGRTIQGKPAHTWMSITPNEPKPLNLTPQRGAELRQYSPSENKLRATAFAARVHSLKYYIGLIGAKCII
ncbi:MAG: hypothetical protein KA166_00415 [Saprospiraceae bacterium]|nr:hypothetical protein [Saprospiraceae bacterium]MBP8085663.1 hypothetical protein [Saprospiraceae bacterium]